MRITEISNEEHDRRISLPYNPPDACVSDENFEQEYFGLYDLVEAVMARYGVNDAYGQADYCLEPYISRSRGLGLEITNQAMITHELLGELQAVIASHAPNWEVYLKSDNFNYGIFIGASDIRLQRDSNSLLKQLFV